MGLNHFIASGNLTKDAIYRVTQNSKAVTNLRLAISGWGEKAESIYINVALWDKQAEYAKDLKKGDGIVVEGRLVQRTYTPEGGTPVVEISVSAFSIVVINSTTKTSPTSKPATSNEVVADGVTAAAEENLPF